MNAFESIINESIKKILLKYSYQLKNKGVIYDIVFNNNENYNLYFSEIEITFWKNENILDVISVITYINGNINSSEAELLTWFEQELKNITER